jgi:hypothetical protein
MQIMRSLLVLMQGTPNILIDVYDRDAMSFLGGWNIIFMNPLSS